MSTKAKPGVLRPLVERLKACPAHDHGFSPEMLRKTWERFQHLASEPDDKLMPAVLAGLILYDEQFAELLTKAEHPQMAALANMAWERYRQITTPPNKLGKIIAATVKEST